MRREGRVPPHNTEAEESVIGAMLLSTDAIARVVAADLQMADFYVPALGMIYTAILDLWEAGHKVDTVTVAEILKRFDALEDVGGAQRLVSIQAATPSTSSASHYAKIITELATLRRMIAMAGEIAELGYSSPADVADAVANVKMMAQHLEMPLGNPEVSPNIEQFLDVEEVYNWLVPGLLEEQDRLILTGGEGGGKSTFFRQIAVTLACGRHPFTFRPTVPVRVLLVDIENTASQVRRKIRPLVELAGPTFDPDNLKVEVRTGGLDLLQRHDHRWLLERMAANKPQVLIIGPNYKLHDGDPNEEGPAKKVISILDDLRARYRSCILMEAHAPNERTLGRPFGASIWRRWPEFGYGIWPPPDADPDDTSVQFRPWRGDRDSRDWPRSLVRGGKGNWPWVDPDAPVVEQERSDAF